MSYLLDISLVELASMIQKRSVSPVEVAAATLEQIEELDPTIGAFIHTTDQLLLAQAQAAETEIDSGLYRGTLHGVPLSVKDIFDVKGQLTTAGSTFLRQKALDDSTAWSRLREAGALLLGKTNLHEFCYGATTVNPHYGTTRNPWNVAHIAGGSSGGSAAAVAAGMGFGSLGSDTGGSTRTPASFTGVVGFKPTRNMIPTKGMFPLSTTLDHVGIITKCALDAQAMWWALTNYTKEYRHWGREVTRVLESRTVPGDYNTLSGLRVGVLSDHLASASGPVKKCVEDAIDHIASLGAKIVEVLIPEEEEALSVGRVIVAAEAAHIHRKWLNDSCCSYSDDVRRELRRGTELKAVEYLSARKAWKRLEKAIIHRQHSVDIVIGPTVPITAPKVDDATEPNISRRLLRCTYVFDVTGQPAISIPCGLGTNGMPVGLQIAAQPGSDSLALAAAIDYELTGGPALPSISGYLEVNV